MDATDRLEALELIHERQRDTNTVTVQIGHIDDTSGIIQHDTLFVQDAPAAILNELRDNGFRVSVEERGARVEK
jgi:hypothetical protein